MASSEATGQESGLRSFALGRDRLHGANGAIPEVRCWVRFGFDLMHSRPPVMRTGMRPAGIAGTERLQADIPGWDVRGMK
jgi:hypothetical protein